MPLRSLPRTRISRRQLAVLHEHAVILMIVKQLITKQIYQCHNSHH